MWTPTFSTNTVSLSDELRRLNRLLDDAEWNGEYEIVRRLQPQIQRLKQLADDGELFYPLF